jgi:hypothetical protein
MNSEAGAGLTRAKQTPSDATSLFICVSPDERFPIVDDPAGARLPPMASNLALHAKNVALRPSTSKSGHA